MSPIIPSELAEILAWSSAHIHLNLSAKLHYLTRCFLGAPYEVGALGEGSRGRVDQNPFVRTDKFDCVTYVNTVLALLHSYNWPQLNFHLARIGYKGANVSYENRHHFISCDWNLVNADLGYVEDVTMSLVDSNNYPIYEMASAYIAKKQWMQKQVKLACVDKVSNVHAYIPYLPLTQLFDVRGRENKRLVDQLPEVAVIEVVRPNWDLTEAIGTHLNVSHIGFLLRHDHGIVFRHASPIHKGVVDEPFLPYLRHHLKSPTIRGINVQKIL